MKIFFVRLLALSLVFVMAFQLISCSVEKKIRFVLSDQLKKRILKRKCERRRLK